jgi:hypothetical protein
MRRPFAQTQSKREAGKGRRKAKAIIVSIGRAIFFERFAEGWKETAGCPVLEVQLRKAVTAK